jgi:hypothetical protein
MNATPTRPDRIDRRSSAIGAAGASTAILAIGLTAVLAFSGAGARGSGAPGGNGGVVVPPPSGAPSTPVVTPAPSSKPVPAPATPAPATPAPVDDGNDAAPMRVVLQTATRAQVHVDVEDRTGLLVGAVTGHPGHGGSVPNDTLVVENLDPQTLKLTWIDYPIDNALTLFVDRTEGGYRFLLIQPEPRTDTDSIAFDRELILRFAEPISAAEVEPFLQGGLDTAS